MSQTDRASKQPDSRFRLSGVKKSKLNLLSPSLSRSLSLSLFLLCSSASERSLNTNKQTNKPNQTNKQTKQTNQATKQTKQVYRGALPYSHEQLTQLGESCSAMERNADMATRDVLDWLKCEFMTSRVGQHRSSDAGFLEECAEACPPPPSG